MSGGQLRVAVFGASGKMGRETVRAVRDSADLEIVAEVDPAGHDHAHEPGEVALADVAVDFTTPESVLANVEFCLQHRVDLVVGTTGWTPERLDTVRGWIDDAGEDAPSVIIVPNFGIGAVLMMRFAALAAPWFESAEIIELHHTGKHDAPSGTARRTAQVIAAAREEAGMDRSGPDATREDASLAGARGASVEGIPVHAVRAVGLVAHQEVLFGTQGETFTLRHDSIDRSSFMPGVLLAIRKVGELPGLTIGLEGLLGLV